MTLQEVEDKFLLFPNYKMKLSTTFTKIANKYIVMKTVDNRLKKNFFYSDYLQDLKKVNYPIVKIERKRISANNIIKIKYLEDTQEMQSPLPEIFTTKMSIGDKKLNKPVPGKIYSSNRKISLNKAFTLNDKKMNTEENNCKKNVEINEKKNKYWANDDDSINSLTFELIQKKANLLSASLNNKNKKELKRRKKQLEAIRQLRQFCFQKLRNKRRCITKSSHHNLLYINNKFDEEDEKNNSSFSNNSNLKNNSNNNKSKNNNLKISRNKNVKNNSKKKYDITNESKKKKNTVKKNKDKKTKEFNTSARKFFRNNSTKKGSSKIKRNVNERKSLVVTNKIISGKLETDILRFKKKKEKKDMIGMSPNPIKPIREGEEDFFIKNHIKMRKKRTGILRESFKEKYKNQLAFNSKIKGKNKINVIFNDQKRNSTENNFFDKKQKTKNNIYSTRNLIKPIKKCKMRRKSSECRSARHRGYSTPNKNRKNKKEQNSDNSFIRHSYKKENEDLEKNLFKLDKKEKKDLFLKLKEKKVVNYFGKNKNRNEIYKVEEEDY
jgi:hypothetical protein